MFCTKCGNENPDNAGFCLNCGNPLNDGQAAYPPNNSPEPNPAYGQQEYAENARILREQKIAAQERRTQRREKFTAVLWLISGILQVLLGIGRIAEEIYYGQSFDDRIKQYSDISELLSGGGLIIMGLISIAFFCGWAKKRKSVKKIYMPLMMCVLQIILFASDLIWRGGDSLGTLMPFYYKISSLLSGNINKVFEYGSNIVMAVIYMLPIFSAVMEFINILRQKSKAETPKGHNRLIALALFLAACFIITSVASYSLYRYKYNIYTKEEDRIEQAVSRGSLNDYPNRVIGQSLDNYRQSIKSDELFVSVLYGYAANDPERLYRSKKISYHALPGDNRYIEVEFIYWSVSNELQDRYQETKISIIFCINEAKNSINITDVTIDGKDLDDAQREKWIKKYIGGQEDLYLKNRGEKYMEDGAYISDDEVFYIVPDYNFKTTTAFENSGYKEVEAYDISYDGETLWLKVEATIDDQTSYYWIPKDAYKEKYRSSYMSGGTYSDLELLGQRYYRDGVYVSNTDRLYTSPNSSKFCLVKFDTSGTKDVYDYVVKAEELWLKLKAKVDGQTSYYWIPKTESGLS